MKTFAIFLALTILSAVLGWPLWINLILATLASVIGIVCLMNAVLHFMLVIGGADDDIISVDAEIRDLLSAGAQTTTIYAAGAVTVVILAGIDGTAALLMKLAALMGLLRCRRCQNALNHWVERLQNIGWNEN